VCQWPGLQRGCSVHNGSQRPSHPGDPAQLPEAPRGRSGTWRSPSLMEGRPAAPIDASTGEWHKVTLGGRYGSKQHWQAKVDREPVEGP
jgi:hypothetical protein